MGITCNRMCARVVKTNMKNLNLPVAYIETGTNRHIVEYIPKVP